MSTLSFKSLEGSWNPLCWLLFFTSFSAELAVVLHFFHWLGLSVARLGSRCIKNQPHQDLKSETILAWVSSSHPPNHLKLDQNCQDIAIYIYQFISLFWDNPHIDKFFTAGGPDAILDLDPWLQAATYGTALPQEHRNWICWFNPSMEVLRVDTEFQTSTNPLRIVTNFHSRILKQLWRVCSSTRPVTSWRVCPKANWKIPTTSGRVGSEDVYAMSAHAVTCRTFLGKSENIYSKKCISNLRGHCGLCVKQERVNVMN